jgi:hypothetical protein
MVARAAVLFISVLTLLNGQTRYSQASEIGDSEFLTSVKEVSLVLHSADSLQQYVSVAAQRNEIAKALAGYGIAIRPNARVILAVTVSDHRPVVAYRDVKTNVVAETIAIHGIYMSMRFFVKAAALRNGKLHLIWVAAVASTSGRSLAEDNDTRKLLFGDPTLQDNQRMFVSVVGDCLKVFAPPPPPQPTTLRGLRAAAAQQVAPPRVATPWAVSSWSEQAKASVDADFARLMSPGTPVDKTPFEGLTANPEIILEPNFDHDECKADPAWRSRWSTVFQRLRWTAPQQPPTLSLKHYFNCAFAYSTPFYFVLSDSIYLLEANVAFLLDGRVVRKTVSIATSRHEDFALEDGIGNTLNQFVPTNIQQFMYDVNLGNSADTPPIP